MECIIVWNKLSPDEWEKNFRKIRQSNVLQSYAYAQAHCTLNRQKARWGVILIDKQVAGLVQILEAGFCFNLFHALMLDRGPLWLEGFDGAAHIDLFLKEFGQQFPQRWGRKRRFIPEIEKGMMADKLIEKAGFVRVEASKPYETLWWALNQNEEEARAALKSNWRGSLQKAEKSDLQITWDVTGEFYPWLKTKYVDDQKTRGFNGISPQLMDKIVAFSTPSDPIIIGKASLNGRDVAGVLFITHGQSATYQIGWSSDEGRKFCAHHLLLWQARSVLPLHGIHDLDLGGINDETAHGVKKFKEGTGAKNAKLSGHYC